ncbi:MAG: hypothetical protein GEV09_27380, partial [Pseudonocardiaceae bacterium]|nr:hypothetical protein [Pseudonocardiaceae bacterium]
PGSFEQTSFTFLGYTFAPRTVSNGRSGVFTAFAPAISDAALKKISGEVRQWRLHARTGYGLDELAARINPIIRGWLNYYGRYGRGKLMPLLKRINGYLVRWARKKYRRLASFKRVKQWWDQLLGRCRGLFCHWTWTGTFVWIR